MPRTSKYLKPRTEKNHPGFKAWRNLTMVVEVTTLIFIVQMGTVICNHLLVEDRPCSSVKQKVKRYKGQSTVQITKIYFHTHVLPKEVGVPKIIILTKPLLKTLVIQTNLQPKQ